MRGQFLRALGFVCGHGREMRGGLHEADILRALGQRDARTIVWRHQMFARREMSDALFGE